MQLRGRNCRRKQTFTLNLQQATKMNLTISFHLFLKINRILFSVSALCFPFFKLSNCHVFFIMITAVIGRAAWKMCVTIVVWLNVTAHIFQYLHARACNENYRWHVSIAMTVCHGLMFSDWCWSSESHPFSSNPFVPSISRHLNVITQLNGLSSGDNNNPGTFSSICSGATTLSQGPGSSWEGAEHRSFFHWGISRLTSRPKHTLSSSRLHRAPLLFFALSPAVALPLLWLVSLQRIT